MRDEAAATVAAGPLSALREEPKEGKFSQAHDFEKPNDVRALNLMNACAKAVVEDQPDCIFAYGVSDEYSFVLRKSTSLYQRRESKLVSVFVSFFASNFVHQWPAFFPDKKLEYLPAFDGRAVCYPTAAILRDYLAWRQVDCHINNQHNTCYWSLVKFGASPAEAQATVKGTQADFKNELLFKRFGINYATLPAIFRKGTCIYRKELLIEKKSPQDIDGPTKKAPKLTATTAKKASKEKSPPSKAKVKPMTMEEKRDLSIALSDMGADMLTGIVDIIKERHADLMPNDEELELDIDALDDGTLRELEQYVEEKMGEEARSQPQAEVVAQSTSRRKRQIVIEHCDIIGANFWKDNPSLLGRDLDPSKKALDKNGAEENDANREPGSLSSSLRP